MPLVSPSNACCSKRACSAISDSVLRFSIRRQCKASVASAVDLDKQPKRKRIAKNERHAMVEAFIVKYIESNAGKFPSVTHVRQMVGGSHYAIRDIVQEIEYSHKFSLSNKISAVQLRKIEETSEHSSDVKEEFFTGNVCELTGGKINGQSFDADHMGTEDANRVEISEVKEEICICNEDEDIREKEDRQHSDSKEEPSFCKFAKGNTEMSNEQISDAKAESLALKEKVIGVPDSSVTKELSSCSGNKDKEDAVKGFESQGEPAEDSGDAILICNSEGKDECLVSDTQGSQSRESVAEKYFEVGSQSFKTTSEDENLRSGLKDTSEHSEDPDAIKKPDNGSPTGLWDNLRSIKDRIFSFWKYP